MERQLAHQAQVVLIWPPCFPMTTYVEHGYRSRSCRKVYELSVAVTVGWCTCRGKFDLIFCKESLALRSNKTTVRLPYADINVVYILDKIPEERTGRVYLVINCRSGVTVPHGKQQLPNFTINVKEDLQLDVQAPGGAAGARVKVCCCQAAWHIPRSKLLLLHSLACWKPRSL
jgi:hypothetical protein